MNKELLEAVEHIIRSEWSTVRQKAVAVVGLVEKELPSPAAGNGNETRLSERMAQALKNIQSSTSSQSWGYYGTFRAKTVVLNESECGEINLLLATYDAQKAVGRG